MRISFTQLLLAVLCVSLAYAIDSPAQDLLEKRISIRLEDKSLKTILAKIESEAEVKFMYSPKAIQADRRASVRTRNQSVREVLESVLKPFNINYRVVGTQIVLSLQVPVSPTSDESTGSPPSMEAAERTIEGTVKDEAGGTLPGVSIVLKGTTRGTTTGADGKFNLAVPDQNAALIFSFVGYLPQEVVVGNRTSVTITLLVDTKALEEVVVVGYGTQSRRNVTGSVTKVDMKQTENLPNTNVTQSLRGRVAGVQFTDNGRPGQNGNILIRGPRSLSGGNNPLIVVDGIFFNGSLADLNPNDIESMEVLKDASSAAIYGARAANGVILITSKKGNTEKPTIRVNAFYGLSDWSYKVNLLTPDRYLQKTLDVRTQNGLEADPAKITDYLTTSELVNYKAGRIVDPWKGVSQQGRISSYDLSLSGRTSLTNYYLSASMANEQGLIFNDNQKRLSLRANIENQVTKWLTVGLNSTYIRRDLSGKEADLSAAYYSTPYGTWYYDDGEPTWYVIAEDQIPLTPTRMALLTKNEEIYNNLFTNFYALLNAPFLEGLSYRLNYSPNYRWQHNYNFVRQDRHMLATNNTSASKFNREDFDWVLENILTYNRQINQDHAFDVTLLYGRNHLGFESTTANSTRLSSDAIGWNDLGLGDLLTNTSTASAADGVSSMARLNYRFKNKYLLTLTARRDGSSVFAANNKYAVFPSGSLAWIVSDEPFLKKLPFIDMLKLRLSYGAVGNQAINAYQSLSLSTTTRYVYGDGGSSSLGIYPSNMANANLKWETTYTGNAAVDFNLFRGRLGGTLELYKMNTRNLLVRRSLPTMTGYDFVWTNLGATSNKGLELTLNSVNLRKGKFEWSTDLVFSTNKNKIVHLYQSDTNGDGKEDDDLGNRWFIGQPVNVAYDYVFDGIYQEGDELPTGYKPGFVRLKDLNGDKKIDASDRTIIGQTGQPKYRWGITNTFRYGNLSLSVFLNAMQGWISSFNSVDYSVSGGNYPHRPLNMIDAGWWTAANKSNTRPSIVYPNPYGHGYYYSRNFVRIQDIALTYDLPKTLTNKAKLSNLRVFLSGKNLHTFTKWIGPDPESGYTSPGDFYPTSRSITLGINAGF
ncbi:TonB-dependent receptor [Larkinella terrae]|uniref:SusC/RagA family TonB-linked outer membrane protein n=1 Tax=Larkinella terrae TaxID=2025311 RepID=A0A7K0EKI4_9BACT|nr:TonB-dependent receptor [Larkinella terrae]MRS61996.1 SusC/RagA family TonB-linked outer membrane protein [Larkinella terrae]